jgi:hypothetical protein
MVLVASTKKCPHEVELRALEDSLFVPEIVGDVEIRTMFAYKSTSPPVFNLYRNGVQVAQGIVTKTRARAYAKVESALAKPKGT